MGKAAKKKAATPPIDPAAKKELDYYAEMLDLHEFLPINVHLQSAQETTMTSLLGSPKLPLTTDDQPERASALVKALTSDKVPIAAHIVVTGIKPALQSLSGILKDAFVQERAAGHDLESVLGTEGMLNVRYRKPTSGKKSTKVSNHAWGTAIDFKLVGRKAPGNTGGQIPRYIAVLLPFFNKADWYSGIGFNDTMHFEVSDGLIRQWAKDGKLKP
jgi:hypothetical protein